MTHGNTPLTPAGRLRMVLRHLDDGIAKAQVGAEFRVSHPTVSTWVARYLEEGEEGLLDRPSTQFSSPSQTTPEVVERIDTLRRNRKRSARRIWHHLIAGGCEEENGQGPFHAPVTIALCTIGRWLHRLGISLLRDIAPNGDDQRRTPRRIRAYWPGHMLHLDVKKVGKIPDGGG